MSKFISSKVYSGQVGCGDKSIRVYRSKGMALDHCGHGKVTEQVLRIPEGAECGLSACNTLYYMGSLDGQMTFYCSQSDMEADTGKPCVGEASWVFFNPRMYLEPGREAVVKLERLADGKLAARMITRPNETGTKIKGKIFFVDKNWKDAYPGIAEVEVVYEQKNCGFIKGRNLEGDATTLSDVLAHLRTRRLDKGKCKLYRVKRPTGFETYILDKPGLGPRDLVEIVYNAGAYTLCEVLTSPEETMRGLTRAWNLNDAFVADTWGIENYFTVSHFMSKLTRSQFRTATGGRRIIGNWRQAKPILPDGMTQYRDRGLLNAFCLDVAPQVFVLEWSVAAPYMLEEYTYDEMQALTEAVSEYNAASDKMLMSKVRKGKLMLVAQVE